MSAGYQALTEKEKQTLRLIVRGHDAKSLARHLDLSVHTVNERLRDARRKLGVSSSREAARLLFNAEGGDPQNVGDKQIGEAERADDRQQDGASGADHPTRGGAVRVIGGVVTMSIFLGVLALTLLPQGTAPSAATNVAGAGEAVSAPVSQDTPAVRSARDWLVLGDQARWEDAWLATATSFRQANTVKQWADAAKSVRPPLGDVISRTALSQESVPAPPAGVKVVKFRTNFTNRANVIETVSLSREGADWKVVGIYVD
jgi:DNA-binding CsgD family transcriptional regulator